MANVAEVKAILDQSIDQQMTVAVSLRAAAEQAGHSLARLRMLFGNSLNPAATQSLVRAEQSRRCLLEAAECAERASKATLSYRTILG